MYKSKFSHCGCKASIQQILCAIWEYNEYTVTIIQTISIHTEQKIISYQFQNPFKILIYKTFFKAITIETIYHWNVQPVFLNF